MAILMTLVRVVEGSDGAKRRVSYLGWIHFVTWSESSAYHQFPNRTSVATGADFHRLFLEAEAGLALLSISLTG